MTLKNELKALNLVLTSIFRDIKHYFFRVICKEKIKFTKGKHRLGSKACFFSSFAPKGIQNTTWKYLEELNQNGFSIFFISTSCILASDIQRLLELCFEVIERENFGQDFSSYKLAFLYYREIIPKFESVLIANDSVVAPLFQLSEIFSEMNSKKCSFWGAIDYLPAKNEMKYHLGSFFLMLKNEVLICPSLYRFWENFQVTSSRKKNIHNGEIALSQALIKEGFTPAAFIEEEKIRKLIKERGVFLIFGHALSQMHPLRFKGYLKDMSQAERDDEEHIINFLLTRNKHQLQLILIEYFRYPFIKKDIISKGFIKLASLKEFLSKNTFFVENEYILKEIR